MREIRKAGWHANKQAAAAAAFVLKEAPGILPMFMKGKTTCAANQLLMFDGY